jgi:hypothetical protein
MERAGLDCRKEKFAPLATLMAVGNVRIAAAWAVLILPANLLKKLTIDD